MRQLAHTPADEIDKRIQNAQCEIDKTDLDGLLVVHHTNLFYYSGTSQDAFLFIPRAAQPVLMVKKSHDRAVKESAIKNTISIDSVKQIPSVIENCLSCRPSALGLELDIIPFNTVGFYQKHLFPATRLADASSLFLQNRLIKSDYEIDRLRQSCQILDQAFLNVPLRIKEGLMEIELAALFEADLRKNGHSGGCRVRAFNRDLLYGNLVSGESGQIPSYFDGPVNGRGLTPANHPHGAGWKKIQKNEPVYIDYTCVVDGYTADAQRVFVMGQLNDQLRMAHETALSIQRKMIALLEAGGTCEQAWAVAFDTAEKKGLSEYFMGSGKDKVKFVGHGVGLELDEQPVFAKGFDFPLERGMTFALEPKFVFQEGAIGVENTFAMTETGIEKLNTISEDVYYI
jgi:Xaa-Pro aminopeptidase